MPTYAIRHRRDTTANWLAADPILLDGEMGYERTDDGRLLCKMGDGVCGADGTVTGTHWVDLPYCSGPAGPSPEFEWADTSIRFRNPDGTWGEWHDIRGERGLQGIQGIQGPTGVSVPATRTTLGGGMIGTGLQVTAEGCISAGPFAECDTPADEATKAVTVTGFDLHPGASLNVVFTAVNSAEDMALAVSGGDAKPVLTAEGSAPEPGDLARGQIYTLMYTGAAWQIMAGMARTRICQTEFFQDTRPRPGFVPLLGGTVEEFSLRYPQAMVYLATGHGAARCFASLAERTAAHVAAWHTLASGAQITWAGLGGVNKFFYDAAEDVLYLPDLAGMFQAVAGDGSVAPCMGEAMGDRVRPVTGSLHIASPCLSGTADGQALGQGALEGSPKEHLYSRYQATGNNNKIVEDFFLSTSRSTSTGAANVPRSWGALACAYLGRPMA